MAAAVAAAAAAAAADADADADADAEEDADAEAEEVLRLLIRLRFACDRAEATRDACDAFFCVACALLCSDRSASSASCGAVPAEAIGRCF